MLKSNLMKNKLYYMLENPKALNTNYLVKILKILQWIISRKPNCIKYTRVGSSETTRKAPTLLNLLALR